ncbi:MAG: class II aldolase/adducin family protein [Candidatus Marithrix sp.]
MRKNNLFHRSSTDGFISLRCSDGGFFITATKTDKIELDFNRISYVHSYDEESNVLTYSGSYLPSSDSVEASVIYTKMPDINAILHTHASPQFTRNPKFSNKIAVPPMRYGEPELGDRLVEFFKSKNTCGDFAIMEDHGELFLSNEIIPKHCIQEIKDTVESNLF